MGKYNLDRMNEATYWNKDYYDDLIQRALFVSHDPLKEERKQKQNCVMCFYNSRMAGQAMTEKKCEYCDDPWTYSSTDTDKLCMKCAKDFNACKRCGSSMDLRQKRKLK